jgi:hypothetical protein
MGEMKTTFSLLLLKVTSVVFLSPTRSVKLHYEMQLHTKYEETFFTST